MSCDTKQVGASDSCIPTAALSIDGISVNPVSSVRTQGAVIDAELVMRCCAHMFKARFRDVWLLAGRHVRSVVRCLRVPISRHNLGPFSTRLYGHSALLKADAPLSELSNRQKLGHASDQWGFDIVVALCRMIDTSIIVVASHFSGYFIKRYLTFTISNFWHCRQRMR